MKTAIISIMMLFAVLYTHAQILNVPGDYETIQAGIDASEDGDTVLVAPGTYFENINYTGKKIMVTSNYIFSEDTNDIVNTIIHGGKPSKPNEDAVVTFLSGEETTSVLRGFTITGGSGTLLPDDFRGGGGIIIGFSGSGSAIGSILPTSGIPSKSCSSSPSASVIAARLSD